MELLLALGGLYVLFKVGVFALKAAFDIAVGSVKFIAAAAIICGIYTWAQIAGLV